MKSVDSTDHIADGGRRTQRTLQNKSSMSSGMLVRKILFRSLWTKLTKYAGPSLTLRFGTLFVHGVDLLLEGIGKMDFLMRSGR